MKILCCISLETNSMSLDKFYRKVKFLFCKNLATYSYFSILQINCNDYKCVEGVWLFQFSIKVFNVNSISDQSFADASSSNISILPLPMSMACQEH